MWVLGLVCERFLLSPRQPSLEAGFPMVDAEQFAGCPGQQGQPYKGRRTQDRTRGSTGSPAPTLEQVGAGETPWDWVDCPGLGDWRETALGPCTLPSFKPLIHQPQPVWLQHFSCYCFLGNPVPILSHVGGGRAAERKGLLAGVSGPSPLGSCMERGGHSTNSIPTQVPNSHSHGHRAAIPLG